MPKGIETTGPERDQPLVHPGPVALTQKEPTQQVDD